MSKVGLSAEPESLEDQPGCSFVVDEPDGRRACGAPRRRASSYCPHHHAVCYVVSGSDAEVKRLQEVEALASVVGGRRGRRQSAPSQQFLRRLEQATRDFSCQNVHDMFPMTRPDRLRPRRSLAEENADVVPTRERRSQNPIERLERAIGDSSGRPARPYRVVDTLAVMERRGTITAGMRQAGEDFRARFKTAQLDPLRAFDISRPMTGRESSAAFREQQPGSRIENARDAVWRAILTMGGPGSAGGSCLWHVLGWERSLKEWALEQGWSGRRVSQEAASGILIAALGALEAHFATARRE